MDAVVIDPSSFIRSYLNATLSEQGLAVHQFSSAGKALEAMRSNIHPSLICTSMLTDDLGAMELRRLLSMDPVLQDTPMVIITGSGNTKLEAEARKAGFVALFDKSELPRFRNWLSKFVLSIEEKDSIRGRILYVEDSPLAVQILEEILGKKPVEIDSCPTVDLALERISGRHYDLVIADYNLEGGKTGLDLVRVLRQEKELRIPILILSSIENSDRKLEILESGANDFVSKPVLPRELLVRVSLLLEHKYFIDQLESQKQLLYELAMRDPLTALFNRRSLFETGNKEVADAKRQGHLLSLLVLDLDHFKLVNDKHGHTAGDQVLREIGALLQSEIREGDFAARFGGEEFVILLKHCGLAEAMDKAETLRAAVEALKPARLPVTASIGAACLQKGQNFEALFNDADQAVYTAKEKGRNQVAGSGDRGTL